MTQKFDYKPIDQEGMEILSVIEKADKFNAWMYQTIKPFCKGRILEIGSGIGNISQFFLKDNFQITLSDIRDNYCDILREKFKQPGKTVEVINVDLVDPDFDSKYKQFIGTFDTVFALNVVEHIENDKLALKNINKLLAPKGVVIILVPAYQALYNGIDKGLEHYRRYTQSMTNAVVESADFKIIHEQYFNAMGIPAWYISGKLQKNNTIPEGQMGLYNKLVPIFKIIDKILFNKFGLSNISVGLKK
jgi:2-polyprenyl-3-methyl-5-hydroxy-6-metoxy-1,4-benzoquinol methylase